MTPDVVLAYLAGIVDGEGYIGVKRVAPARDRVTPSFHARIAVKMADREAVDLLLATFGGTLRDEPATAPGGRPMVGWQVFDVGAERVLRALLPYLRVKRASALVALELRDLQATSRQHRTKVIGSRRFPNQHGTVRVIPTLCLSDEYVLQCTSLHERAKAANQRAMLR